MLHHPSPVEHQDIIYSPQGAQAMGNNETRAAGQQAADSAFQGPLRHRIQTGGCLIQDHQVGIGQKRPHQGQELRLAGGERDATGCQLGVQPVRQEMISLHQAEIRQGHEDAAVVNHGIEEGEVIPYAGAKKLHLLGDQAHPTPQFGESRLP